MIPLRNFIVNRDVECKESMLVRKGMVQRRGQFGVDEQAIFEIGTSFLLYILLMNKENSRPQTALVRNHQNRTLPNTPPHSHSSANLTPQSRKECHDHYMRYLIAANADYFRTKSKLDPNAVQPVPKGKPNNTRFKVPSGTGMTIYRKDFKRKQAKYNKEEDIHHNISTIDCIKTNNYLREGPAKDARINDKSSYQREFKYHPVKTESCGRPKKRLDTSLAEEEKVPRFLDTQNKIDFLNWAGKNYVPSMKPQERPAVTNLPFQASTVYKSDFESKAPTHTPIIVREPSYPNFSCVPNIMKSSYTIEFSDKRGEGCESSCKPRHFDSGLCKLFKGTTEYKREFIHSRKPESEEETICKTLQDMQTLIIDL